MITYICIHHVDEKQMTYNLPHHLAHNQKLYSVLMVDVNLFSQIPNIGLQLVHQISRQLLVGRGDVVPYDLEGQRKWMQKIDRNFDSTMILSTNQVNTYIGHINMMPLHTHFKT